MRNEKKITVIPASVEKTSCGKNSKLRVAAYCRVSTDSEEQMTSYDIQINHYESLIYKTPEWTFAGIFADEASGTSAKKREQFKKMIKKCEAGEIDLILTKSISRFARNTLDCVYYTRVLRELGVGVIFEKENINTLNTNDEFLLTLLGSLAQAESESMSRNIRMGKQFQFQSGEVAFVKIIGYKKAADGEWEVIPEEAEIIKRIFRRYLDGLSLDSIKKELENDNIPSARGLANWTTSAVRNILINERYIGDALLQKTYVENVLSKKVRRNTGELPMYYVKDHHVPIIDRDIYYKVQAEMAKRQCLPHPTLSSGALPSRYNSKYALTGLLYCGYCDTRYKRVTWSNKGKDTKKFVWRCVNRLDNGTKYCKESKTLEESVLHAAIIDAVGSLISKESLLNSILESVKSLTNTSQQQKDTIKQSLMDMVDGHPVEHLEYNDYFIRQLITDIDVFSDKLVINFKDGTVVERGYSE